MLVIVIGLNVYTFFAYSSNFTTTFFMAAWIIFFTSICYNIVSYFKICLW